MRTAFGFNALATSVGLLLLACRVTSSSASGDSLLPSDASTEPQGSDSGGLVDAATPTGLSDAKVPTSAEVVRIANLNCENLFNDVIDSPGTIAGAEAESTPTPAAFQEKLRAVAAELAVLKGDVAMLQEIENDATLANLQARAELGGLYKYRALVPGNDPRGIDVAVLSRFPVTVVSHKSERIFPPGSSTYYSYARDVVEAHIAGPSGEFVALGVHYRSQINTVGLDDEAKRLAEANGTRAIVERLLAANAALPLVVLGDFNDQPTSPPLTLLKGGNPLLVNVATELPASEQWSISFGGTRRLYDMQWVAPAMWQRYVKGSAAFVRSPASASDHSGFAASYKL